MKPTKKNPKTKIKKSRVMETLEGWKKQTDKQERDSRYCHDQIEKNQLSNYCT